MNHRRQPLSVYKIRHYVDGEEITEFEQALRDPNSLESWDLNPGLPFNGRLFLQISDPTQPLWADFLGEGVDNLTIPNIQRVNAVLFVKILDGNHIFAFTFGYGRYLLRPDCYEINYGLRVALNILYDKSNGSYQPECIKSVVSKTVAEKTIRTWRQTDRRATFETFGVDIQRDLLRAVTGAPTSSDMWGSPVSGSDSISLHPSLSFVGLGNLCKDISEMHSHQTYEDNFKWVDNLRVIRDPAILKELQEMLVDAIKTGSNSVSVTVPEFVEWDKISGFYFSFDSGTRLLDPEDADLHSALERMGKLEILTIGRLRSLWQLKAVDANGQLVHQWSLIKCLAGEFTRGSSKYILTEGEFFEINQDFLEELDEFIGDLPPTDHLLPNSPENKTEGDYNQEAADQNDSYLLLDKKIVRMNDVTSPIEICDILTDDKCFIHVKRKLGSSSLSHLFAQGLVSADLFLMSKEYRLATLENIREAEQARANASGNQTFIGRFSDFNPEGIKSEEYEVSYAIVAKWNGRNLAQALPFFSKINLRRHVEDLRRMGYEVSIARVMVQ
ncbi:MAG: TIGR04141 family sporadically distributed protein [Theionarchaea archaeon]|nr:TIGR04141 family sporadically distributed protein [Theionarchaea archaeon]